MGSVGSVARWQEYRGPLFSRLPRRGALNCYHNHQPWLLLFFLEAIINISRGSRVSPACKHFSSFKILPQPNQTRQDHGRRRGYYPKRERWRTARSGPSSRDERGKDEKSLRMAIPEKTGCVTVECTPAQRHPPLPGHHTLEEKSQYFPALAPGRKNIQRAKGSE